MAAKGIALHKIPHFATVLVSAALEWLLIFLLFIHAIFAYSITKLARYCNLQVPCLLCSRLDHVLGSEKHGFYWDLICRHHKVEMSSLVICHVHNKLVDVHSMCENCLFSFAKINKPNAEIYRLLVGKLGIQTMPNLDENPFEDHKHGETICSCCNEPYILNNHPQKFLQNRLDFDDLNNRKEPTPELDGYDPLPHVEYSKVNNFSDTESEVPFSDDDDGIALLRESADRKQDFVIRSIPMVPRVVRVHDDFIFEKFIGTDSKPELSLLDVQGQTSNNNHERGKHASSTIAIGNGLEEISWLPLKPEVDIPYRATNSVHIKVPQACDLIVTQIEESRVCVDRTETVELEQLRSKQVAYGEIKPAIEHETSAELSYVENYEVTKPVQLEQGLGHKVTIEETKPVPKCEASPEIPSVVTDKVTEANKVEQISNVKFACDENKPVVEREAGFEMSSVVNNKIPETYLLDQTISKKVTHEEIKPVIGRGDIPPIGNPEVTETDELKQRSSEKVAPEEIKPAVVNDKIKQSNSEKVTHEETSLEIPPVIFDKVTESVESDQIISEKVTHEKMKADLECRPCSESPSVVNDYVTHLPDNLDLGEAYNLAVGTNRRQLSGKLSEQRSVKESIRMSEDLKLLLSQISPRLSGNADEMRTDSSSAFGMQILQRRISLERNESGLSLDGSVVGEVEGESEVDWLKRQVEHDKKLLGALYKELEEERNASTIAANQAMAMITRLQEEKASLQMEALQCIRMMEEQAGYDVEALQKANDLLAEKDKEIQDLEADLEYFRNELEDTSMFERVMESSCGLELRELAVEQSDSNYFKNSENVGSNSTVDKPHAFAKDDLTYNSYSEFEEERLFILECLRRLEKKLYLFSYDRENSRKIDDIEGDLIEPNGKDATQEISSREKENDRCRQCYSQDNMMRDAGAIGDAVSNLIRRLEALESGCNGIDQSFKSLKGCDKEVGQKLGNILPSQGFAEE